MDVNTLKNKRGLNREDIAALLASIGAPGKRREEKLEALKSLNKQNNQGHGLELTAESYAAF